MAKEIQEQKGEIVIYKTEDGQTAIDVRLQDETVWLTQKQIASLFGTQRPAITKHLRNIFKSKELQEHSVSSILEHTARDGKTYRTKFYNLDAILSLGYRINSPRATRFRVWATTVLRDHLVKGYTLNEKRLQENRQRLKELEAAVALVEKTKSTKQLSASEAAGLLTVITKYTRSWLLLHQYDAGTLQTKELHRNVRFRIDEETAKKAVAQLKKNLREREEAGDLFGRERERGTLKGILAGIEQTFGDEDLYRVSKKRRRICSTSSSKTIRLLTATNASLLCCLFGFWRRTMPFWLLMGSARSTTTRLLLWRCWWPKAIRGRKT